MEGTGETAPEAWNGDVPVTFFDRETGKTVVPRIRTNTDGQVGLEPSAETLLSGIIKRLVAYRVKVEVTPLIGLDLPML